MEHLKEFIPKAFPGATDLILDSEVLMLDTKTQKPLPFGTLGVHKVSFQVNSIVEEASTSKFPQPSPFNSKVPSKMQ